jgi:hypothetical protein
VQEDLTFEDGVLLCKHIYQTAIDKTLMGIIEQEEIFYKADDLLNKLGKNVDNERLEELFFMLNIDNVYSLI